MFAFVRGWKTVDFAITVCTDELGPVIPRTFAPAPAWSTDGHRIKAPLDYSRGEEKVWIYGALRVRDGKELTRCAAVRNSKNYIELLKDIEADNPLGDLFIITDNLTQRSQASSICRRAGGASSAVMRSLDRVLPMPMRSSKR